VKSTAPRERAVQALAALHDVVLLVAVFYAPILWGQVSIPETSQLGQLSASGGQTIVATLVAFAALAASTAWWVSGQRAWRAPNAIHLPTAILLIIAVFATIPSVNRHASFIELTRLLVGAGLFFLVANRFLMPVPRSGVVAVGFVGSLILLSFVTLPGEAAFAVRIFAILAVGVWVAVVVTRNDDSDPIDWWRYGLVLSAAVVVALYGWWEKIAVAQELKNTSWQIFSTFFNPNPLGGFFAIIFPLALSQMLASKELTRRLVWGFCSLSLAVTIYPTYSKGAFVALAAAILVYLILLIRQSRSGARIIRISAMLAFVLMIAVGIAVWRTEPLRTRLGSALGTQSSSNMFRILTWRGTVDMASNHPWLGIGPGAFKYIYPKYAVAGYVEAAHQNYLQMFAELGMFGGIAFIWLLAAVLLTGARAMNVSTSFRQRIIAIGSISSITAFMVHSLLDYDWYIGAINLSVWLVAGSLAYQASKAHLDETSDSEQQTQPRSRNRNKSPRKGSEPMPERSQVAERFLLLVTLIVIAGFCIWIPARNALAQQFLKRGDAYAMSGQRDAGFMALDQYERAHRIDPLWPEASERYGLMLGTMKGLDEGVQQLKRTRELSPMSFRPLTSMAQLYWEYKEYEKAVHSYEQAITLFPHHTKTMKRLAEVYENMGETEEALRVYRRMIEIEDDPFNKYRALADVDVDTNFAFAHYALGRAAQKEYERGEPGALDTALKEYGLTLSIIADYFERAKKTDDMFLMLRRPREYRAEDMKKLEAKVRWRMGGIFQLVGDEENAQQQRTMAATLWSEVEEAVAEEAGGT